MDGLRFGFRELLGGSTCDAIKIVRILRLNSSILIDRNDDARESHDVRSTVDPLVADADGELRAAHVTTRVKLKRLKDMGYIRLMQDAAKASRKRVVLPEMDCETLREMEHMTARLLDLLIRVQAAQAAADFDPAHIADEAWNLCDTCTPATGR